MIFLRTFLTGFLLVFSLTALGKNVKYLTLSEAIAIGMSKSTEAKLLLEEEQRLQSKKYQYLNRKRKYEVSASASNYKNEVADSQDLEANTASETQQVILSFKQTFENGFYWKISRTQRTTKYIESDDPDVTFSKNLLSLSLPFYGKSANKLKISNKKEEIVLEGEFEKLNHGKITLQTTIAKAYLKLFLSREYYKNAKQHSLLIDKKLKRKQSATSQVTEFETRDVQLESLKLKQDLAIKKVQFQTDFNKLALILDRLDFDLSPVLEPLPTEEFSLEEMRQTYHKRSVDLNKLREAKQTKTMDLRSSQIAKRPDISIGGYTGETEENSESGNNTGLTLSITYNFAGGESQKVSVYQHELAKLELSIQQITKMLDQQAEEDFLKLQSARQMVGIHQDIYLLNKEQYSLSQNRFRIGQLNQDDVVDTEIKMMKSRILAVKKHVETWLLFLQILEKTDKNISFAESIQ